MATSTIICNRCTTALEPGMSAICSMGKYWHPDCFLCRSCGKGFGMGSYVPFNGHPYHTDCAPRLRAPACHLDNPGDYIADGCEVKAVEGKGNALVASRDISAGSRILIARAIALALDDHVTTARPVRCLLGEVVKQVAANPSLLEHFKCMHPSKEEAKAMGKVEVPQWVVDEAAGVLDDDTFQWLGWITRLNAHGVSDSDMPTFRSLREGAALFSFGSYVNHSCRPNSARFFAGDALEVYALRDIASGEEITDTYIPLYNTRATRHKMLAPYGFDCKCGRCEGKEGAVETNAEQMLSATLCEECKEGVVMSPFWCAGGARETTTEGLAEKEKEGANEDKGEVAKGGGGGKKGKGKKGKAKQAGSDRKETEKETEGVGGEAAAVVVAKCTHCNKAVDAIAHAKLTTDLMAELSSLRSAAASQPPSASMPAVLAFCAKLDALVPRAHVAQHYASRLLVAVCKAVGIAECPCNNSAMRGTVVGVPEGTTVSAAGTGGCVAGLGADGCACPVVQEVATRALEVAEWGECAFPPSHPPLASMLLDAATFCTVQRCQPLVQKAFSIINTCYGRRGVAFFETRFEHELGVVRGRFAVPKPPTVVSAGSMASSTATATNPAAPAAAPAGAVGGVGKGAWTPASAVVETEAPPDPCVRRVEVEDGQVPTAKAAGEELSGEVVFSPTAAEGGEAKEEEAAEEAQGGEADAKENEKEGGAGDGEGVCEKGDTASTQAAAVLEERSREANESGSRTRTANETGGG